MSSIQDSSTTGPRNEERPDVSEQEDRGISLLQWQIKLGKHVWDTVTPDPPPAFDSLPEKTSRQVRRWFSESSGSGSNILWLSGLPTSSTVGNIKALCQGSCILAAIYSFSSRKGSEQTDEMVASMALQIISNFPNMRRVIGLTVFHYPSIFSEDLDPQLEALIFNPFRHNSLAEPHPLPAVIVIDSLELYHDIHAQRAIISSIEVAATTSCIPLRFLLTSRQGSQELGLPLRPNTHVRIHNGSQPAPLPTLQRPLGPNESPMIKPTYYHGFPPLLQTQSCLRPAESYTRSLLMLGHGMPLWRPTGDLGAPAEYINHGPQPGDVMHISQDGVSQVLLNIFRAPDDPVNERYGALGQYMPLVLDPSEITRVEDYFEPGTYLTSGGVVAAKQLDSPLTINFRSNSEEGAFLVLPGGASREDLDAVAVKRLHKYVQRWAPSWYQGRGFPNGSIFVVTGCDKASDFASGTFWLHPDQGGAGNVNVTYVACNRGENPWQKEDGVVTTHYCRYESAKLEPANRFCVFVRGMRVALGTAVWSANDMTSPFTIHSGPVCTSVLHKSTLFGRTTEQVLERLHFRKSEGDALFDVQRENYLFHPIYAIAPALFHKHPKASTVIINDSDWSALAKQDHGNWTNIKSLIERLFSHFDVAEEAGVVFLTKRSDDRRKETETGSTSAMIRLFRQNNGPVRLIPVTKFALGVEEIQEFGPPPPSS